MPYIFNIAFLSRPSPEVEKTSFPSHMYLNAISGLDIAIRPIRSVTYPASVESLRKNFILAGTFANRFFTTIEVPRLQATSSFFDGAPCSSSMYAPSSASSVLLTTSTDETAQILASASPRKPIVLIRNKSSTERSLLVAWRKNAVSSSSAAIPLPLSVTPIYSIPPRLISTHMSSAPASIAFSTSSLTTAAGLSATSPAAILSATLCEST